MSHSSDEFSCTDDTTSGALVEEVLNSHNLSPEVVSGLGEAHLLFLMPLILNQIQQCKVVSPLLEPLRQRICTSRRVKLRFLLLRKHPAFLSLPTKLAYSSSAYGVKSLIATRILPPSCSGYLDEQQTRIVLKIPVDMVDLQSEDFFRTSIFKPVTAGKLRMGMQLLSHPFCESQFNSEMFSDEISFSSRDLEDGFDYEGDTFQTARLKTVSGQRVAELQRLKLDAEEVKESNLEILLPKIIIRENQDVLKTQATQILFYLLNHVWSRTSPKYEDAESAPICLSFDAVATHARKGLLQTFNSVQSFLTFSYDFWRDTKGRDPVAVDRFVRSAAGALTASYIIGVGYAGGGELCVMNGATVFVRETDGVFESMKQQISVPKALRECFRVLRVWDEFRLCCIRAFDVARATHEDIFPLVTGLYARCGLSEKRVAQYLSGKRSLNLGESPSGLYVDEEFRKWLG